MTIEVGKVYVIVSRHKVTNELGLIKIVGDDIPKSQALKYAQRQHSSFYTMYEGTDHDVIIGTVNRSECNHCEPEMHLTSFQRLN